MSIELDPNNAIEESERSDPSGVFNKIIWAAWWFGTALIVLSWLSFVSNTIGWIGFGIACLSTLTSVIAGRYWRLPR